MDFIKLTHERLDVAAINDLVLHESCGAVSMFIGTTRDNFENKKVISLEYEAYESMATKVMKTICDGIRVAWPDIKNIAMYHRLGVVPVKDASVVIAMTSPHRESSLKAVAHAIDELKKSVPIFKKEIYDGSNSEWKQNNESGLKISKFSKRPKLDFNSCRVDTTIVPKTLIQITADENEMSRRIQCFVEKKREEINLNNTLDFIAKGKGVEEEEQSCARVNSIAIKQKDCKGLVRIHRVKNESGPQIKPNYTITLDKLTKNEMSDVKIKDEPCDSIKDQSNLPVQEQRIQAIENFFKITPNSKDINDRLKTIEDKILFLETVSPEYHHFIGHKKTNVVPKVKKQVYSLDDLDKLIQNVKSTNATLIKS